MMGYVRQDPPPTEPIAPALAPRSGKLDRGPRRAQLIRMLAQGDRTRAQLARYFDCDRSSITEFADRWKQEIETAKADIENEFADLWIADKRARLAEYQDDIARIHTMQDRLGEIWAELRQGPDVAKQEVLMAEAEALSADAVQWARVKQAALRAAADELGQIPAKMQLMVDQSVTHVVIEGVDLDDLGGGVPT